MEEQVKVLVTGAKGFVGKNLVQYLLGCKIYTVYECDIETSQVELAKFCKDCQFVFHLAGVNRPQIADEFISGNYGFTTKLIKMLKQNNNKSPILMSSSIQATLDNDYGKSKKMGEDYLIEYGKENNVKVYVFRLPNVFGKWCKPNYNSAVATFCYNSSRNLPITVNNRETMLELVYIDDVVNAFVSIIRESEDSGFNDYYSVSTVYAVTLGRIVDLLENFKKSRKELTVCNMDNDFEKKLYSAYLSYLPEEFFSYDLKMNIDARGSFTEFLRSDSQGQISVNISKPNIVKGNHWHNTKNEKFLVVSGSGIIRFRKIGDSKIIEYRVSGEKMQVVDIPCGYTHNIENIGENDMTTIMWVNECFDPHNPDTFYEEVEI